MAPLIESKKYDTDKTQPAYEQSASSSAKLLALVLFCLSSHAQIVTSQYNNARTGAIVTETTLTPANVNSAHFGKVFSLKVDGDVYGQPLFLPHVEIPGKGVHNVLYVATEHDSVFAFDADVPSAPLWHVNFLNASAGVTTVPARDVRCPFVRPEIGITPTPVIDVVTGTIYVLARTKQGDRYVQKLHALAVATGAEKFRGPVEIEASGFDPLRELPRAALLLVNGQVYLTWGSSCDVGPYHGWVMAYDAKTLAQTAVLNTSPDAEESGIWQSDMGPAADEDGNVYVATGNGKFTAASGGRSYGDSVLKLARGLQVLDYFTPYNENALNREDADVGSGGPMVLGKLVMVGGKDGSLYVLDRSRLGKFRAGDNGHAVQVIKFRDGVYAAPAHWNGHVYVLPSGGNVTSFAVAGAKLVEPPQSVGTQKFGNPGATPAISANGTRNGIVWLIETKTWNGSDRPAVLHAYDAANVSRELYNSEQNAARDRIGLTLRFTIPTVVNGRVYVDAKGSVDVFGLLK